MWDSLCREYSTEANNGQRAVWFGPSVRSDLITPDVKVKSYRILPELSLMGPFETVELSLLSNKKKNVQSSEMPPTIFPAKTPGPPEHEQEQDRKNIHP